ncbi:MAG: DUF1292 domain-containing protein [Clostridia bacterium]|nr:DUF1292 domain-containing protein [Clostridia bacterium]
MEEERDLVVFSDDDGDEFELEVIDYFDHEGEEYAVMVDAEPIDDDERLEVYIMKIVVNGDMEEFLPADDDKMEELSKIVEARFESGEWGLGCDCGCEECGEGCDCGCED